MRGPLYIFVIVFLSIAVLPEVYIWWRFVPLLPWGMRIAYALTTALSAVAILVIITRVIGTVRSFRLFFLVFLLIMFPKAVFALLVPVFGTMCALIVALLVVAAFAYSFIWGWRRLKVRHVECAFPHLPEAFDGYRILQVSDLHVGSLGASPSMVSRIVETANAQHPDLIVFTGDLINGRLAEMDPYRQTLASLHAPDGVLAVTGNHDYGEMGRMNEFFSMQREMGWKPLINEHVLIGRGAAQIAIVGVEHTCPKSPFVSVGDLKKALKGIPEGCFKVLLSHNPAHWRMEVLSKTDIPLMLSGHTHAAQLKVLGLSPARLMYREWGGMYREGEQMLYVSLGISGGVPFRLGAWPEINVITLRK